MNGGRGGEGDRGTRWWRVRAHVSHISNRGFQPFASLYALGNVSHDIGPDVTKLLDEDIHVIDSNFGHVMPSRKELMMGEGRGDRSGKLGTFVGGEALEDTVGIFAGLDILEIELEEFLDGRSHIAVDFLVEIGKGDGVGGAAGRGVDKGPGGRAGKTPPPKHATNRLVGKGPGGGAGDTTRRTWEQHG